MENQYEGIHEAVGTNYFYNCMFALTKGEFTKIGQDYTGNLKDYYQKL